MPKNGLYAHVLKTNGTVYKPLISWKAQCSLKRAMTQCNAILRRYCRLNRRKNNTQSRDMEFLLLG